MKKKEIFSDESINNREEEEDLQKNYNLFVVNS